MMGKSIGLVFVTALASVGQPALAEWQCLSAGSTVPAALQVASNYLSRAENVYSEKLLGVLRAGDRVYLINARDDGWSERVRLGLMELRLAEPDITAARRFQVSIYGGPVPDASGIPVGEFVCLGRARATRQGLAFRGEAVLIAAGRSVHLVDPVELGIVVEVRALGGQPLDLREIFAASARAGIYAGLFRGRAWPGPVVAVRPPESAITFPVGPIERPNGEVVIMARAAVSDRLNDAVAADVPAVPAPVTVPVASAPPAAEQPPARVVTMDVPTAPLPVKPAAQEIPATVIAAVAEPVPVAEPAVQAPPVVVAASAPPIAVEPARVAKAEAPAALPAQPLAPAAAAHAAAEPAAPVRIAAARVSAPAVQAPGRDAEQSYEDYARTMKSLMELRRSGAVRSISEMTYVHPAVEDLRARR